MTPLRKLVEKALTDLDTLRHPNVEEAQAALDRILVAAKLGSIEHDTLEAIDVNDDRVWLRVTWIVRQCADMSEYEFPSYILDADDPIKAGRLFGLNKRLAFHNDRLQEHVKAAEVEKSIVDSLAQEIKNEMEKP